METTKHVIHHSVEHVVWVCDDRYSDVIVGGIAIGEMPVVLEEVMALVMLEVTAHNWM